MKRYRNWHRQKKTMKWRSGRKLAKKPAKQLAAHQREAAKIRKERNSKKRPWRLKMAPAKHQRKTAA
jgi:hypothetical protein